MLDLPRTTPKFDLEDFNNTMEEENGMEPLEDPVLKAKKEAEAKAKEAEKAVQVCFLNMNLKPHSGKSTRLTQFLCF